jgi:O-antigen ligase
VGYHGIQDYTSSYQVTHNSFINTLAEVGLLGYIPWFLLIFMTIVHMRRAMNIKGLIGTPEYTYLSGLFSALVGYLTAVYFLTRQYNHVLYILLAMAIAQTLIVCQNHNAYDQVFGTVKKDYRRAVVWALGSIPLMWISVRLGNLAGGR